MVSRASTSVTGTCTRVYARTGNAQQRLSTRDGGGVAARRRKVRDKHNTPELMPRLPPMQRVAPKV